MCYNDVGVKCKAEVKGLSEISAHRPGDHVSGPIDAPLEFDAGAVDTTVTYTSGCLRRSLSRSLRGEQQRPANRAEKEKVNKINTRIEQLDWLSDYGFKNRGVVLGWAIWVRRGRTEALDPAHLDRAAPDHDEGCLAPGAGHSGRREPPEGRPDEPDGH